jgi:hypothetical protein
MLVLSGLRGSASNDTDSLAVRGNELCNSLFGDTALWLQRPGVVVLVVQAPRLNAKIRTDGLHILLNFTLTNPEYGQEPGSISIESRRFDPDILLSLSDEKRLGANLPVAACSCMRASENSSATWATKTGSNQTSMSNGSLCNCSLTNEWEHMDMSDWHSRHQDLQPQTGLVISSTKMQSADGNQVCGSSCQYYPSIYLSIYLYIYLSIYILTIHKHTHTHTHTHTHRRRCE